MLNKSMFSKRVFLFIFLTNSVVMYKHEKLLSFKLVMSNVIHQNVTFCESITTGIYKNRIAEKGDEGLTYVRCSGDELGVKKLLTKPCTWKVRQSS